MDHPLGTTGLDSTEKCWAVRLSHFTAVTLPRLPPRGQQLLTPPELPRRRLSPATPSRPRWVKQQGGASQLRCFGEWNLGWSRLSRPPGQIDSFPAPALKAVPPGIPVRWDLDGTWTGPGPAEVTVLVPVPRTAHAQQRPPRPPGRRPRNGGAEWRLF